MAARISLDLPDFHGVMLMATPNNAYWRLGTELAVMKSCVLEVELQTTSFILHETRSWKKEKAGMLWVTRAGGSVPKAPKIFLLCTKQEHGKLDGDGAFVSGEEPFSPEL
jgi:hypothetical protein